MILQGLLLINLTKANVVEVFTTISTITSTTALLGAQDLNNVAIIVERLAGNTNIVTAEVIVSFSAVIDDLSQVSSVTVSESQISTPGADIIEYTVESYTGNVNSSLLRAALAQLYPSNKFTIFNQFSNSTWTTATVSITASDTMDAMVIEDQAPDVVGQIAPTLLALTNSVIGTSPFFISSQGVTVKMAPGAVTDSIDIIIDATISNVLVAVGSSIQITRATFGLSAYFLQCSSSTSLSWPQAMSSVNDTGMVCTSAGNCTSIMDPTGRHFSGFNQSLSSVSLGSGTLGCQNATGGQGTTIVVAFFGSFALFPSSNSSASGPVVIDSLNVLDIKIGGVGFGGSLPQPFVFRESRANSSLPPSCVYYNASIPGWSSNGCTVVNYSSTDVFCQCTHLTSFALLLSTSAPQPSSTVTSANSKALDFISYIGLGVSIFCLLISIFTFLKFKKLRNLPKNILLNMCIMLLISQIIFIAGVNHTGNVHACRFVAVVLHYCLLSTFCWILVEGYNIHDNFTAVFEV